MRILVIDDNVDAADSLKTLLGFMGHEAQVAYRGEEGIEKARAWHPSVIVADIGLPDINGYTVAERLRQDDTLRDATLVAITAYDSNATQKRAYDSGFDLFLAKPADVTGLVDMIVAKERNRALHGDEIATDVEARFETRTLPRDVARDTTG